MKKRVGILTSGGDCPGLNATIRGAAKALYQRFGDEVEIVGIQNGYDGLIKGEWREMQQYEFSGILTVGGTILGTKRTPFKMMTVVEDDKVDKVAAMKKTYKDAKLDCLLCLGGNGTHKAPGVAVVVTPQPLAADGAFQVCSGIPIRLDASQQKGLHIPLRGVAHVVLHQVFSQTAVTFSAHVAAPSF